MNAPVAPPAAPTPQQAVSVGELIAAGNALEDQGEPAAALARYKQVLQLQPQSARAHLNAGNAYRLLGENAAAIVSYRQATALAPENASAHFNLATALFGQSAPQEAQQAYRSALGLRPDWVDAWIGLGCALEECRAPEEAVSAYSRAIAIQPTHIGAVANLSNLQVKMLDVPGARHTLTEYLGHVPHDRFIKQRLAYLEMDAGRVDESLAIQRALIKEQPNDFDAWNILFFQACFRAEVDTAEDLREHQHFGRLIESQVQPRPLAQPVSGDRERRLRVGYVSGDFKSHPAANFIHPVLRCHDRQRFEVFCYFTQNHGDHLTVEFKTLTDHWRDAGELNDDQLADQILQDRIDILVDLAGHSSGGRLGVFARKPAPLQYTWLGYLGTTGLSRMDYRLCDFHTDPVDVAEHWQTEVPARMPDSQWCYDQRCAVVPAPTPLPSLRHGYWTFGSFNNYRKLNPRVLAAWAGVLKAIPGSRLKLFSFQTEDAAVRVRDALAAHGVEAERLSWHLRGSPQEHFGTFADVDVALDSFPYNGATTTCDALLMGVPVLAVAGDTTLARGAISLLNTIGMPDWIAASEALLPAVAQRQLADVDAIAQLRAALPQRMRASPLMDAPRFTRNLESQYHEAWQRWCEGRSARAPAVPG
jgi:protein O-GlcNAc transferase